MYNDEEIKDYKDLYIEVDKASGYDSVMDCGIYKCCGVSFFLGRKFYKFKNIMDHNSKKAIYQIRDISNYRILSKDEVTIYKIL